MALFGSQFVNRNQSTTTTTPGTLASTGLFTQAGPVTPEKGNVPGLSGGNYAYTREAQDDAMVENRLNNLTASDSRYIQQARQGALRQANRRGLLNSSIAAGAAEGEAIRAGLPIASQDASTVDQARGQSMDAENQGLMQTRELQNRITLEQMGQASAADAFQAGSRDAAEQRRFQLQMQREGLAYEGEQAGLNRAHQLNSMGFDYGLRNQFADNDAFRTDWMGNQNFNREFYGQVAAGLVGSQVNSTQDFFSQLNQRMIDNPDMISPDTYVAMSEVAVGTMRTFFGDIFAGMLGG